MSYIPPIGSKWRRSEPSKLCGCEVMTVSNNEPVITKLSCPHSNGYGGPIHESWTEHKLTFAYATYTRIPDRDPLKDPQPGDRFERIGTATTGHMRHVGHTWTAVSKDLDIWSGECSCGIPDAQFIFDGRAQDPESESYINLWLRPIAGVTPPPPKPEKIWTWEDHVRDDKRIAALQANHDGASFERPRRPALPAYHGTLNGAAACACSFGWGKRP